MNTERKRLMNHLKKSLKYHVKPEDLDPHIDIYRVVIKSPFGSRQIEVVEETLTKMLDISMRQRLTKLFAVAVMRFYDVQKNDFDHAAEALQRAVQLLNGDSFYVRDLYQVEQFSTAKRQILDAIFMGDVNGADCDDSSILLASALLSIGIPAEIVLLDGKNDGRLSHAITRATNPINGKKMFLESIVTKNAGWRPKHQREIVCRPKYWKWNGKK